MILLGGGILGFGYALYYGLQAAGYDALVAGNIVQIFVFLGIGVGYISTYIFRVANKVRVRNVPHSSSCSACNSLSGMLVFSTRICVPDTVHKIKAYRPPRMCLDGAACAVLGSAAVGGKHALKRLDTVEVTWFLWDSIQHNTKAFV